MFRGGSSYEEIQVHGRTNRLCTDNGLIEAFNGRLRQECLNESWFLSLEDAREKVEAWRQQYNRERPHSALGNMAPLEYALSTVKAE